MKLAAMNGSQFTMYRTDSGGGPLHSKTLPRNLMAQITREASWTAPALWRFLLAVLMCASGLFFFATSAQAHQTESGSTQTALTWFTDLPIAQAKAKAEGKFVLLFFHGSGWCPPCVEMQRQVIDSPAFAEYARRALVLVDVDFPEKSKQPEELKRTNIALKSKFNLSPASGEGFPTLVLLNQSGEAIFQETGYFDGGIAEVLPKLQRHTDNPSPAANAGFKNVTVEDFAKLAEDKQHVILDVRTAAEFNAGHIAGAVNLDVNAPDFQDKAAALDKGRTYLVHCASGVRSVKACHALAKLDFPNLYNLTGGFKAWAKAGKPVEK
jgi:phage shock protein E